MNSNPANNRNLQWDVDRYLLSDPSFDRDAFEQRMLEDLELAELVTASVADLRVIVSAVQLSETVSVVSSSTSKSQRKTYWAMLVTAAAVLLMVSVWQLRSSSNDDQLSQIADNWVAFEGLTTGEALELIASEDQALENHADAESNEQTDWLVEAAREFYLAKNDGAAG
jgi:hypothetical protein